jgi:hypothetical protein
VFTRSHTERISSSYARKAAIIWKETLETANDSREAPYSFLGETPCEHRVTPCPLDYLPRPESILPGGTATNPEYAHPIGAIVSVRYLRPAGRAKRRAAAVQAAKKRQPRTAIGSHGRPPPPQAPIPYRRTTGGRICKGYQPSSFNTADRLRAAIRQPARASYPRTINKIRTPQEHFQASKNRTPGGPHAPAPRSAGAVTSPRPCIVLRGENRAGCNIPNPAPSPPPWSHQRDAAT